jgi:hypothetical protein
MKTVVLIALLVAVASAGSISEWVSGTNKFYESNQCFRERLQVEVEGLKGDIAQYAVQQSIDLHAQILARVNTIKVLFQKIIYFVQHLFNKYLKIFLFKKIQQDHLL